MGRTLPQGSTWRASSASPLEVPCQCVLGQVLCAVAKIVPLTISNIPVCSMTLHTGM